MNFLDLFKMNMKVFFRDRMAIFWMTVFPLILLGTFGTVFSSLRQPNTEPIPLAINSKNPYLAIYEEIPLFEIRAVDWDLEETAEALNQDQVKAFIDSENQIFAAKRSIQVSIVRSAVDSVRRGLELGPAARNLNYTKSLIKTEASKTDPMAISLLSMFSLYVFYSYFATASYCSAISAEQSASGIRHEIAPFSRLKLIFSGFISNLLYSIAFIFLLKFYTDYILKLDLIPEFWQSLPVLLSGSLCGAAIGLLIGSIPRLSDAARINLGVFVSLFLGLLSGMMSPEIYLFINEKVPIVARLNPLSRLTVTLFHINHLNSNSESLACILYFLALALICILLAGRKLGSLDHKSLA
ncbi:MAG: ABC transporter permease [Eubacteriales bacterium]|nr:ABC transporter permease [Eubacteriales bacterium]